MEDKKRDVTYFTVAGSRIGIIGFQSLVEVSKNRGFSDEEELAHFLLEGIKKKNYIPASWEKEYLTCVLKEYKKSIGSMNEESDHSILEIKILGMGCHNCTQLMSNAMETLSEMKILADIEHVKDAGRIGEFGVVGVPALIINGNVKSVGNVLSKGEIKKLIKEEMKKENKNST